MENLDVPNLLVSVAVVDIRVLGWAGLNVELLKGRGGAVLSIPTALIPVSNSPPEALDVTSTASDLGLVSTVGADDSECALRELLDGLSLTEFEGDSEGAF